MESVMNSPSFHSMDSVALPEPVTDVIHGVAITDPYRWLEDQNSPRTRAWIETQCSYTRTYFASVPARAAIRDRVTELLSIPSVAEPWNIGDRYFFLKRYEGGEQPVIVVKNGLFGEETILIDPAGRRTGASTAVAIAAISEDGRFLAYSVRQGGTDHAALEILDIERKTVLPDRLPEGFCNGFVFDPNGSGFYYSHRELHDARPNYRAAFWHRFGTERSEDREVFVAGEEPNLFLGIIHSRETKVLAYTVFSAGKRPHMSIYLHLMETGASPRLLLHNIEGCFVPFFMRGHLLGFTDLAAPNFRIVRIDVSDADPGHWHVIVPESDRRIRQFAVAGDQIFVTRVDRFSTRTETFGLDGQRKKGISFPAHGTVNLLNGKNLTDKLFFSHTSICKLPTFYCDDTHKEEMLVWEEANAPLDPSVIAVEEVAYNSKDGTSVPLFLAARKDLLCSGALPTFLTGYGGFA